MGILNTLCRVRKPKQAQRKPPEEIECLRTRRFRRILKHVLTNSRFYRDYYGKHGIDLGNADSVPLDQIPTIDKKIMMDNFDDFVCDLKLKKAHLEQFVSNASKRGKKYSRHYRVVHTCGSSGSIGLFVYGPGDWDRLRAMVLARVSKTEFNLSRKIKLAYMGATDGNYAGISLVRGAPRLFYRLLPLHINNPIERIVTSIQDLQPDTLSGYSSGVYLLAKEQIAGRLDIRPRKIICSADPLTPKIRETIRKAFGVDPIAFYAASESIAMAAECAGHNGFHLFDDWHIFELVDKSRDPVPAGKPGRLILTTLYNYTQPLIRYEMNDEIVLDDKPCACSWCSPTIRRIGGRSENFLWFEKPDGRKEFIHPLIMVEFMVPGLRKLQVVQRERNRLTLRAVIEGDPEETRAAIRRRMQEILTGKELHNTVEFDMELVDKIENDPRTGKYRFILPFKP